MNLILKYFPILLLLNSFPALAQQAPAVIKKDTLQKAGRKVVVTDVVLTKTVADTFSDADTMPEELLRYDRYIKKHIKAVPGVHGVVQVRFTSEPNGAISHIKVVKSLGKAADHEALRLVRAYAKWQPLVHDGKPESSVLTLPVEFK